jgi:hypothetical protein
MCPVILFEANQISMDNNVSQAWKKIEDRVRQDPVKAVLLAFASGFLFSLLPLGKLLSVGAKLAFLLVKPALFILGIIKILEYAEVNLGCRREG